MTALINASTSAGVVVTSDTSGSLAFQSNGTTIATISSTGLTMNSGNIVVASTAAPAFSAYAGSATSLSGGAFTKVIFDTEEFDTNNNFASSRFTPTIAGYYQINASVSIGINTQLVASIYKNGGEAKRGNNVTSNSNGSGVNSVIYFNGSTDYVEIYCFAGTTTNCNTGSNLTYFNGSLIRSA